MQAIISYQAESHQSPPYHTDSDASFAQDLPPPDITIATYPEISFQQRYKLKWKVWNAKQKKKSYDTTFESYGN